VAWDAHPGATVPSRGVPARRRIAALAATLAVAAAPGVALAQNGAGDEQYEDPFQTTPAPKATTKPKPTPVQPVPHQQVQTQQQPQSTATATQTGGGGELPRTGLDLAPLALAGIALVAAGLVLRRRAGHGSD
jgi:LPXTG-motif cell wall-anchored protein